MAGKKYMNDDVTYTVFKKHRCPVCGAELSRVKTSRVVNAGSPDAKDYDASLGDSFLTGDVEYIWKEFFCPVCEKRYTVDEMKQIEKGKK